MDGAAVGMSSLHLPEISTLCDGTAQVYAVVALACVVSWIVFYRYTEQAGKVKLVFNGQSKLNQFIATNCATLQSSYHPPWWAMSAHVQVLLTVVWPQAAVKYSREMLRMQDGGHVAIDWLKGTATLPDNAPVVLVLHGLTGCSDGYRSFCADALEAGYRPVVFNKRGHGGSSLSVPLLQAFGCVKDMKEVIHHIQRLFPVAPIVGLLCSYLGETGKDSKLQAGVFVSPGYDSVELFCNGGIRAPYDSILTYTLKKLLRQHEDALSSVVDYAAAMQARSVAEFDRHVYMALHGYDDLASYWKHNNPMRAVENIAVPVLCINAKDDPVCTYGQINWSIFDINPNSMLAITTYGSHCGFFELTSGRKLKSWASKASLDYLSTALHYLHTSISSSKVKEQL
ncbi:hypothetical protein, variant [Aphanomyces invadans]|uniref:AB hydrolase-1 domain-containing protein n=1 Tax=Aphanomyces invadans TaxID=157072 RepID=A0A024UR13_9STRA|nr:hypothetical protein, variant [Aphanomyces invadans]ETW08292.1 hypothetical protein, variant [Aphanomyces invadans]|eukprot:XP_008862097.1 hypothetical protein, variant [Aphanomyces invadans]